MKGKIKEQTPNINYLLKPPFKKLNLFYFLEPADKLKRYRHIDNIKQKMI